MTPDREKENNMSNVLRINKRILTLTCTVTAFCGLPHAASAAQASLPVPVIAQQQSNWCWAAVGEMITTFLGAPMVRQCVEVNVRSNVNYCCSTPSSCNFIGWPEYEKFGFAGTSIQRAPTFAEITTEIGARRPMTFSWDWVGGGSHIMVVSGYSNDNSLQQVLVTNPAGAGSTTWMRYSKFLKDVDHTFGGTIYKISRDQGNEFSSVEGGATDVAVGTSTTPYNSPVGTSGTTWVIGTIPVNGGYSIYKRTDNYWTRYPGGAVRIAVTSAGQPWVVNSWGAIYALNLATNEFELYPGRATDIGIGINGAVWIVGTNPVYGGYEILRWNASSWTWTIVPGGAVRIAVDPQGLPWVVNAWGAIYAYNNSMKAFVGKPGYAKDIGIGGDGTVWIVSADPAPGGYQVYRWNGSAWLWSSNIGGTNISVGSDGRPWITDDVNNIYSWK